MDSVKQLKSLKNEVQLVRVIIYIISLGLATVSIWKYWVKDDEFIVGIMGVISALIFILLLEWSRRNQFSAFNWGVIFSGIILSIYLITFRYEFEKLISWDTLLFVFIDAYLRVGDNLNTKISKLEIAVSKGNSGN